MNRLAKVCARYLGGHRGFSIGIKDVTPDTEVNEASLGAGYGGRGGAASYG